MGTVVVAAATTSELRESINRLSVAVCCASGQRALEQRADVRGAEMDSAIHSAAIEGKPGPRKQFGLMRRDFAERRSRRQQGQLLDREPRHALTVRPAERLRDERYGLT